MGARKSHLNSSQNATLQDQVFLNDLVLRHIFKYLPPKELIQCRHVHPLWLIEATKILRKMCYLQSLSIVCAHNLNVEIKLPFKSSKNENKNEFKKQKTLEKFTKFMRNAIIFPFTSLDVTTTHWGNGEIQAFFKIFGGQIKQLSVTMKSLDYLTAENMLVFQKLIVTNFPNLNYFHFGKMAHFLNYKIIQSPGNQLKAITTISVNNSFDQISLFHWLIKEAPNLRAIRSPEGKFDTSILNYLIKEEKVPLLKDLRFDFCGGNEIQLFKILAARGPKLECIHELQYGSVRENLVETTVTTLNAFLKSSCETLQSLTARGPIDSGRGLIFPPFPNLKHLTLSYHKSIFKLFPKFKNEKNISEIFPALETITLNFINEVLLFTLEEMAFALNDDCCGLNPLLTVTELHFSPNYHVSHVSSHWLKFLRATFPNIVCITLPRLLASHFEIAAGTIWEHLAGFECLKEVRLGIVVVSGTDSYLKIEAGFTGFTEETCAELRDPLWGGRLRFIGCSNIDELRKNPSIVDLKGLRKLWIEFESPRNLPPMTEISRRFAFELCPQLQVSISTLKP